MEVPQSLRENKQKGTDCSLLVRELRWEWAVIESQGRKGQQFIYSNLLLSTGSHLSKSVVPNLALQAAQVIQSLVWGPGTK